MFHFTMHPPYRVTSKRGAKINLFYLYAKRPPLKLFIIIILPPYAERQPEKGLLKIFNNAYTPNGNGRQSTAAILRSGRQGNPLPIGYICSRNVRRCGQPSKTIRPCTSSVRQYCSTSCSLPRRYRSAGRRYPPGKKPPRMPARRSISCPYAKISCPRRSGRSPDAWKRRRR